MLLALPAALGPRGRIFHQQLGRAFSCHLTYSGPSPGMLGSRRPFSWGLNEATDAPSSCFPTNHPVNRLFHLILPLVFSGDKRGHRVPPLGPGLPAPHPTHQGSSSPQISPWEAKCSLQVLGHSSPGRQELLLSFQTPSERARLPLCSSPTCKLPPWFPSHL